MSGSIDRARPSRGSRAPDSSCGDVNRCVGVGQWQCLLKARGAGAPWYWTRNNTYASFSDAGMFGRAGLDLVRGLE